MLRNCSCRHAVLLFAARTTSPFIDYYSKSKSKFNGVFPVSNEFDLEKQYFSETEKKEIIEECLKEVLDKIEFKSRI